MLDGDIRTAELVGRVTELEEANAHLHAQLSRALRSSTVARAPRVLGQRLEDLDILWIGPCHIDGLSTFGPRVGCRSNHLGFISWPFEQLQPFESNRYDAIVAGLTLRYLFLVLPGEPRSDFYHLREDWNAETIEEKFEAVYGLMQSHMQQIRASSAEKPLFFVTFLTPSFNFQGSLIHDVSLTDIRHFVARLNEGMCQLAYSWPNTYVIDINQICSSIGRMHLQDDVVSFYTHAGFIGEPDVPMDQQVGRIVAPISPLEIYDIENKWRMFNEVFWDQLLDNIKIIRQIDAVKLIIVDLDDTLWRGVAAEPLPDGVTDEAYFRTIGWPMALAEGLLYFKRRGGLLAICSKNSQAETEANFARLWGQRLCLSDFFSVKINWETKSANIAEILGEANVLPEATVFIDDNPREISEVLARFPAIRTLGFQHYDWRRIIMQSPETQVAQITRESRNRTELVQARVGREATAATMDRETWLCSLGLKAGFSIVSSINNEQYARACELLNKTNQFNTTGARWQSDDVASLFARGGYFVLMRLSDAQVDNGIVGVTVVERCNIVQSVLSCRVFSLGAEEAMLAYTVARIRKEYSEVTAKIIETEKNLASRNYFERNGFVGPVPGEAMLEPATTLFTPAWIAVATADE